MADLQPVRPPRSRLGGHGALIGTIVVIGVLVAAVKPWGGTGGLPAATLFPTSAASPLASDQSANAAVPTSSGFDLRYRPELFGPEPPPRWGLWPAGYVSAFGFAAPVPPVASPEPAASREPAVSSDAPAGASASARAGPSGSSVVPVWPARIDVGVGNHLLVLGISTPIGYSVPSIKLFGSGPDGSWSPIETELLPTPWPDHFTAIGIRSRSADGSLTIWSPGRYRLDWVTDPGSIRQSIEITIEPVDGGEPVDGASTAP